MSSSELSERRKHSSDLSLGLSGWHIHSAFLRLLSSTPKDARVLDFGAGQGSLIRTMRDAAGFTNLTGADLMTKPRDLPANVDWIQADLNHALPQKTAPFDVVLAAEVIEHLENPRAVVRSWRELLKPGGRLILSTPNNESARSLLALVMRGHFVDFGDKSYPAHITAVLKKDLERILSEEGFTQIEFHYTNHGLLPRLTKWTWQHASLGILRGKRFSDNLIVSCVRPR